MLNWRLQTPSIKLLLIYHVEALEILLQGLCGVHRERLKIHELCLKSGPNLGSLASEVRLLCDLELPKPTCTARAIIMLPRNKTIPAVIMFGDSIVDTGNNNYIETIFKVNYPPYGKDFSGGKPTGRFCDEKVPSDLFVEELGIKELLPPYLDPTLNTNDLRTGVNFASGGAGFDPQHLSSRQLYCYRLR